MNSATRLAIIADMHQRELDIIRTKGREYTLGAEEGNDGDTLANLKNVAARTGTTPMQVWAVYFLKHIDAISSYVMDPRRDLSEPISGRIDDARTYLGMLECLVREGDADRGVDPVMSAAVDRIDCDRCDDTCPEGCPPQEGIMWPDRIRVGIGLPPEPPSKVEVIDRDPVVGDRVRVKAGHAHGARGLEEGRVYVVTSAGLFTDRHILVQVKGVDGDFASTRFEVIA